MRILGVCLGARPNFVTKNIVLIALHCGVFLRYAFTCPSLVPRPSIFMAKTADVRNRMLCT